MIKRVTREQIEAGLAQLQQIDPDAANSIRAYSDYRALIKEDPLALRDRCLAMAEHAKGYANKLQELAMYFERLGRGENDGSS